MSEHHDPKHLNYVPKGILGMRTFAPEKPSNKFDRVVWDMLTEGCTVLDIAARMNLEYEETWIRTRRLMRQWQRPVTYDPIYGQIQFTAESSTCNDNDNDEEPC